MVAPPRSPDGPLNLQDQPGPDDEPGRTGRGTSDERPATRYGRSATVYGRTVIDPEPAEETPPEEPGFLGFVGVPEPVPGRHSVESRHLAGTFDAAGLPPVALGLAVLALLIGGVATITGIVAVGRATSAQVAAERAASAAASAAAGAQPASAVPQPVVPQPAVPVPLPSPPSPTPRPSRSLDPDRLDPLAAYELAYDRQFVRVPPSTCEGTDIDLDEPRVLPPAGADAAYRSCADGFHLDFDGSARFAVVTDPGTAAQGCADAIRSDPGVGWVGPTPGTTVCVLTSRLAAEPQQLSTKLARVRVEDLESDGTLVAALTAWVVP